jgi:membrane associated rhomboid family serine protease
MARAYLELLDFILNKKPNEFNFRVVWSHTEQLFCHCCFGELLWEMISLIVMGTQLEQVFKQSRCCGEWQCHHGGSAVAKFNRVKNLAMN